MHVAEEDAEDRLAATHACTNSPARSVRLSREKMTLVTPLLADLQLRSMVHVKTECERDDVALSRVAAVWRCSAPRRMSISTSDAVRGKKSRGEGGTEPINRYKCITR